jgi:hypothetical protein
MRNLSQFKKYALPKSSMKGLTGGTCTVNVWTKTNGKWHSEQFTTAGIGEAYQVSGGKPFDAECC